MKAVKRKKASKKLPIKQKRAAKNLALSAVQVDSDSYVLRLYLTGTTPQSQRALANIKRICEEHLKGRYKLEVVDIYQRPTLAKDEQIIAAPTLIKSLPLPLRRLIGDLSNEDRVLLGLDIRPENAK
jgi:circadian clock protein KaiB